MSLESLRHPVEKFAFVTSMNLPPALQRRLAGRPVVLDGQTLAVDTQLMLRLTALAGEPDPSTLSVEEGRAALLRQAVLAGGTQKIGSVRTLQVGDLPARLYIPTGAPATGPLLVFLHGGGFVFGDLGSHDSSCRYLAEQAGVRLLAIYYRLAPENPFPAAYDDALAAFDWAHEHAAELGADPARIGTTIRGLVVRDIAELTEIVAEHEIAIAVLATPASVAQDVSDRLVAAGVTSILNFAPVVLSVPDHVDVRKVDLAAELQILSFHETRKAAAAVINQ